MNNWRQIFSWEVDLDQGEFYAGQRIRIRLGVPPENRDWGYLKDLGFVGNTTIPVGTKGTVVGGTRRNWSGILVVSVDWDGYPILRLDGEYNSTGWKVHVEDIEPIYE